MASFVQSQQNFACSSRRTAATARVSSSVRVPLAHRARVSPANAPATARRSIRPVAAAKPKSANTKLPADTSSLYSSEITCPLGAIKAVMRPVEAGILSVTKENTLQDTIEVLNKVTGCPVLDDQGRVIGVISRKDIIRVRKAGGSLTEKVADHMTSPAVTVLPNTPVQEAADLMLSKNIRRVPVVDEQGRPVGLVSRSDIFKTLGSYDAAMKAEAAAMNGEGMWLLKYLYDGDCPMCQSMKGLLERQDGGRGRILFVNLADPNYNPSQNMGISYEDAMETICTILPDGSVLQGTEAIKAMYAAVGLGWLSWLMEQPFVTSLVDILYDVVSKNRISLGQSMDMLLAGKKLDMSKQGVNTCADVDEACSVDW